MRLQTAALTHKGYVRKTNQDAILALGEVGLFAVADGLGGERAGDEAAERVIAAVERTGRALKMRPPENPDEMSRLLRATLVHANEDVKIHAHDPEKWGMGSTATVLCLRRGIYGIAHVGDSRIYLLRDGNLRLLTRDHTLVWLLFEQGKLNRDELEHHRDRHLLTQCIGTLLPIEIDECQGAVKKGDIFLICSDGLNGYVPDRRIHFLLLGCGQEPAECANALLDEALRAGGGDNVSVVVARVEGLEADDDWQVTDKPKISIKMYDPLAETVDPMAETLDKEEPADGKAGGKSILPKKTISLGVTLAMLVLAYLLEMRFL